MKLDLAARGEALEDAFFSRIDASHSARMRALTGEVPARESLALASGIDDIAVLSALEDIGVTADAMFALALAPLVIVAWADGAIQERERQAILQGAAKSGVEPGSLRYQLLLAQLERPVEERLQACWTGYVAALVERLQAKQRKQLMAAIVDRARAIAEAAGGFLGLARIARSERDALTTLAHAFQFPEQFETLF